MANRTSSFKVEIKALPHFDSVWDVRMYDEEGARGPGSHMYIVANSLELAGKALDEYLADRKMTAHEPEPERYRKRKKGKKVQTTGSCQWHGGTDPNCPACQSGQSGQEG